VAGIDLSDDPDYGAVVSSALDETTSLAKDPQSLIEYDKILLAKVGRLIVHVEIDVKLML